MTSSKSIPCSEIGFSRSFGSAAEARLPLRRLGFGFGLPRVVRGFFDCMGGSSASCKARRLALPHGSSFYSPVAALKVHSTDPSRQDVAPTDPP